MGRVSDYVRLQVESVLQPRADRVAEGVRLFLMPADERFRRVYELSVLPALRTCGIGRRAPVVAFDSDTLPADVCRWIQSAEVIVADLTHTTSHLLYVLGLCHGLGRCPILIGQDPDALPFHLHALRFIDYTETAMGYIELRKRLTRAVRVFVASTRGNEGEPKGE